MIVKDFNNSLSSMDSSSRQINKEMSDLNYGPHFYNTHTHTHTHTIHMYYICTLYMYYIDIYLT